MGEHSANDGHQRARTASSGNQAPSPRGYNRTNTASSGSLGGGVAWAGSSKSQNTARRLVGGSFSGSTHQPPTLSRGEAFHERSEWQTPVAAISFLGFNPKPRGVEMVSHAFRPLLGNDAGGVQLGGSGDTADDRATARARMGDRRIYGRL